MTVTVVDDETHAPLGGATVSLTAFVSTAADPVLSAEATAGDDGEATFTDVPLRVGQDDVSVAVEATLTESTTSDGCTITEGWTGASDPVVTTAETTIELDASRESSAECIPPGAGAPVLHGIVLGPDGLPLVPKVASVSMRRADGGSWQSAFTVADTGFFSTPLEAWGTADEPADLVVHVIGAPTGTETDGDCTYELAPEGSVVRHVALAGGDEPAPMTVLTDLARVSGVCGTSGTPVPTRSPKPSSKPTATATATATTTQGSTGGGTETTPRPTLPPTDAAAGRADGAGGGLVATLGVLLLAGIAAATSVVGRRSNGR